MGNSMPSSEALATLNSIFKMLKRILQPPFAKEVSGNGSVKCLVIFFQVALLSDVSHFPSGSGRFFPLR